MAETPREGKQTAEDLRNLIPNGKWTKRSCEDSYDTRAELDTVAELNAEDRIGTQAIRS